MRPPELITRTNISFDPEKIVEAYESLPELPRVHHAVAVTSQPGAENPLHDGVGAHPEEEMTYNVINAEFRGTFFEEILRSLPFPFGRTRIMWIPPQKCYPVHTDHSYRYHLALDTHDHAFLLFPGVGRVYHIPADGYLYKMDARQPHTAVNCGPLTRAHLVIVTDQQ